MARIVAVHGIATSARVWDRFARLLSRHDVLALERPRTGSLETEVAWLAEQARDAWVVGMSGGATLGLALASRQHEALGLVLHEPAAGSLVPELLTPARQAFALGGTNALARTLYGSGWSPDLLGDDSSETVAAELTMFSRFEPAPATRSSARVVVTVGARSGRSRHEVGRKLAALGYEVRVLGGAAHFVGHDQPVVLASLVEQCLSAGYTGIDSPSSTT